MRKTYNYTKIKERDSKIYEISGTTISTTGISVNYLKIFSIVFVIFNIFGVLLCLIKGENLYMPIKSSITDIKPGFLFLMVGGPIGISSLLKYKKIQNYSLLEYLIAYFKKKEAIDIKKNKLSAMKYKQKTFIENIINLERGKKR
mgnify:CR=1 FL=1